MKAELLHEWRRLRTNRNRHIGDSDKKSIGYVWLTDRQPDKFDSDFSQNRIKYRSNSIQVLFLFYTYAI